jgi:integrase
MKRNTDKKNFFINGIEFKVVKGKGRWYIEYYTTKGVTRLRTKVYAGINRIKNDDDRIIQAYTICSEIAYNGTYKTESSILLLHLDKYKSTYRKKTYQSKRTRIKIFVSWLNDRGIKDTHVNSDIANDFILYMLDAGKANATIKSYIHTLAAIYRKTGRNPFENCIKIKVNSTSLQYFNEQQKKDIINCTAVNHRPLYYAIKILYSCFVRPGEMRLLKREDFNFGNNTIALRPEVSKNGKYQHVTIPEYLAKELIYIKNKPAGSYVFGYGYKPVGLNYFNNEHTKILHRLNIKGRYAFYSWKHTGVVDAVRAGINIKDIQLQLRHHSLDMVNEYLKNLGVMDSDALKYKMPEL